MTKVCKECGCELERTRQPRMFCSTAHRQAFNNRRLERGAALYDLFMAMRYDRDRATELGLWAIMCRMAKDFREEDERERDGRKSWQPADAVLGRLPVIMREKDVMVMQDKTGRSRRVGWTVATSRG